MEGLAPSELLVQHPWCRCVDEEGPEDTIGLLGLAKLIVFGRWGQWAAFSGLWQHSKEHGGISGASECHGMALGSWLRDAITGKPTVSERLQN